MGARHLTPLAAERFATFVRDGDWTRTEMVREIDDWCAAAYGWPLTTAQAEQRDEFVALADKAIGERP